MQENHLGRGVPRSITRLGELYFIIPTLVGHTKTGDKTVLIRKEVRESYTSRVILYSCNERRAEKIGTLSSFLLYAIVPRGGIGMQLPIDLRLITLSLSER